ncbi:hypothetical protein Hanom_Chr02g00128461 [Helianthus anomalus]
MKTEFIDFLLIRCVSVPFNSRGWFRIGIPFLFSRFQQFECSHIAAMTRCLLRIRCTWRNFRGRLR